MNIFISYRRSDSQYITERLIDKLNHEFDEVSIFQDVESIAGGRLVHEVSSSPLPYMGTNNSDPIYYTAKSDFHPSALKNSYWRISEDNDVQECLDSLVGAAKTMGGNVLADFEIHRTTYQVVWRKKDEHLIIREAELFLPADYTANKVQELPVVVVKGLVCVCDSI